MQAEADSATASSQRAVLSRGNCKTDIKITALCLTIVGKAAAGTRPAVKTTGKVPFFPARSSGGKPEFTHF